MELKFYIKLCEIKTMTIIKKLKNLIFKSGLHRKEQMAILFTVICFALSGLFLPSLKKNLSLEADTFSVKSGVEHNVKKKTSKKADKNICKTPLITEDTSQAEEDTDKPNSEDPDKSSDSSNAEDKNTQNKNSEDTQTADASEPSQNQNTTSAPASSGSSSGSSSSSTQPSQSGSSSSTTPSTPSAPAKVWVPPVYQTVHHDAVYQTVKVVICNYCGAEFSSTGEFQVHKDANGG